MPTLVLPTTWASFGVLLAVLWHSFGFPLVSLPPFSLAFIWLSALAVLWLFVSLHLVLFWHYFGFHSRWFPFGFPVGSLPCGIPLALLWRSFGFLLALLCLPLRSLLWIAVGVPSALPCWLSFGT